MNMKPRRAALLAIGTAALACAAFPALAYVGPGAGLTLLGALWGLILAVVMSVAFVILWPFRRLLRRNKRVCTPQSRQQADGDVDAEHSMLANPSDDRNDRSV
jgi:membrane protein implicated in regulation of membrane protease activity